MTKKKHRDIVSTSLEAPNIAINPPEAERKVWNRYFFPSLRRKDLG